MSEAALKSGIWVTAQIRLCDQAFLPAVITRRGDPDAGAVLVKLIRHEAGTEVLTPVRDTDGKRAWMRGTGPDYVSEPEADAYIEKQIRSDPDLWVLEIEDPKHRYRIDGKVL